MQVIDTFDKLIKELKDLSTKAPSEDFLAFVLSMSERISFEKRKLVQVLDASGFDLSKPPKPTKQKRVKRILDVPLVHDDEPIIQK